MNSSALDRYLESIEPWAGLDLGVDVSKIPATGAAGDTATAHYALAALREAWIALPADLRAQAIDALESLAGDVIRLLAETASTEIGEAIQTQISSGVEANPILAAIVKVIFTVIDVIKAVGAIVDAASIRARYVARAAMFPSAPAFEYVFRKRGIKGFPSYRGAGSPQHRWAACLPPDKGGMDFFFGTATAPPSGKWREANGVALECDVVDGFDPNAPWGGCKAIGNKSDAFSGLCMVNALAWPYWSPNYPTRPMPAWECDPEVFKCPQDVIDPNRALIAAQLAALLSPDANFRIWDQHLIVKIQAMRSRWISEIAAGGNLGTIADPENGKRATDFETRWTPDLEIDPGHIPTDAARRFYFGADGLIRQYPGFEHETLDLATIGMNPDPQASGEQDYAMTIADFNASIASARSVLTARAAFLQDRTRCAALVADGKATADRYGKDLADAVHAGAKMSKAAVGGIKTKGGTVAAAGGWAAAKPRPKPRLPSPPPISSSSPKSPAIASPAKGGTMAGLVVAGSAIVLGIGFGIAAATVDAPRKR